MSNRTTRTAATAMALTAALSLGLTACGGDDSSGGEDDKIAGADKGGDAKKTASPKPSKEPGAPTFDLPKDVALKFDVEKTGDEAKDELLRDVAYAARAEREAYTKGTPGTENLTRYWKYPALPTLGKDVKRVHDQGMTLTGDYRFYDFKVKDLAKKEAWVTYCMSERNAFGKEIKTGKIKKTEPSKDDFIQYTSGLAKNAKGDWQVVQAKRESGVQACAD